MKKLLIAIAAVMVTAATYGQGQVVFANRVGAAGLDAPVFIQGTQTGPGPSYSAQLFLVGANDALTPIATAAFRAAGTGTAATADRYWVTQTVDVPVAPGSDATFLVRAWETSAGSYEAALNKGESARFTVPVGGGTLPPGNLIDVANPIAGRKLESFNVAVIPEPSVIALGVLGAAALLLRRRK